MLLFLMDVRVAEGLPPNEECALRLTAVAILLHTEGLFGSGDSGGQYPYPELGFHGHASGVKLEGSEASCLLV